MGVAVVYLSYIPYGTIYLERFLASYQSNPAGQEHELIILFNGYQLKKDAEPFLKILEQSGIQATTAFTESRFDISAYLNIAKELTHPWLAFLNTYSLILHPNWLLYLYQNIQAENIACVGATGSWGNKYRDDQYRKLVKNPASYFRLAAIKEMIKYRFNFYPAVSAHIRTNSFLVRRTVFLKMEYRLFKPFIFNFLHGFKESKLASECFEHGKNCMTKQMTRLGFELLLVNKNGIGYPLNEWNKAGSFWQGEQENLLISDNQTEKYRLADAEERSFYQHFAWGSA